MKKRARQVIDMLKRTKLNNGIRVVYENIPYVRSVSVGIWVGTGSRNEDAINNGISHFIEHMMFKGTKNRSAKEIAAYIDSIGGQLNAFTGKEYTCYYAKTLDTHIDIALDVLSDMFFNSLFAERDMEIEKQVIIEEINMYDDTPEELVHDILSETMWDGDPLGYPILGRQSILRDLKREMIIDYIDRNYTCSNTVISVAGNFDENKLLDLVNKYFSQWNSKYQKEVSFNPVEFRSDIKIKQKDTEQIHLCVGFKGIEHGNDDLYPMLVVNNVLGGGMSSRLFQKIREEKGLVYSIYSYPSSYVNSGSFVIYAGMNPEQVDVVVNLILEETKNLLEKGIDQAELNKGREQLKGNYMLGLESTNSRMNSMGKSELLLGYINTPEEILERIDNVNMDSVNRVIKQIFDFNKMSIAAVGKFKKDVDFAELIKGYKG